MRALLPLVAMALLAGCAEPSTDGLEGDPAQATAAAPVPAPTLRLGDWWALTPSVGAPFTVVVAEDQGSDWVFRTDEPGTAFFDLHLGDISYLGPQRKADLAGSQGSDRVQFFSFPLTDNKTWTTTWDAQQVTVHATREGDRFHMMASNATGPYAHYTYDPALRWFSQLDFLGADGSPSYSVKVERAGGNYTGTLAHWTLDTHLDLEGDLAATPLAVQTYEVPAGTTDVWVDIALSCTAGTAAAGTAPAPFVGNLAGTDDRGAGEAAAQCPLDFGYQGTAGPVRADPNTGHEVWGYSAGGAGGAAGTIALTIVLRTYEARPFGA